MLEFILISLAWYVTADFNQQVNIITQLWAITTLALWYNFIQSIWIIHQGGENYYDCGSDS